MRPQADARVGLWVRSTRRTVTIENVSNFSEAVSNAAAREWPKRKTTITPYCFRHQAAADTKAAG
jgi:hypothetical protein